VRGRKRGEELPTPRWPVILSFLRGENQYEAHGKKLHSRSLVAFGIGGEGRGKKEL